MAMTFEISEHTKVAFKVGVLKSAKYGINIFARDFKKVFGTRLTIVDQLSDADILFRLDDTAQMVSKAVLRKEQFRIEFPITEGHMKMLITVADSLAFMKAVVYMSEVYFGIAPFHFWLSQGIIKRSSIDVLAETYVSKELSIKYRGWFINDEDCIIGWTDVYPPPREVWLYAFESLIRCGGNMVLAGTDLPKHGDHHELASELGLYITQHHCAPMDGEMFLRAYPNLEPSFDLYEEEFCRLWEEGVISNTNKEVIWVLGFRGQGDIPFWENDKRYDSDETRGALISSIIEKQYEILKRHVNNPTCCIYLYQETMALYQAGHLTFSDEFIKIWSDNGYGKMITRRHGNWDPRIVSLPDSHESTTRDGVYYHVAFHDLEASNHLTMLNMKPNGMIEEIDLVKKRGNLDFLLINSANIKQHTLALSAISHYWLDKAINQFSISHYCETYYHDYAHHAEELIKGYFDCKVRYGPFDDNYVGDEYYHHPVRKLIQIWMSSEGIQNNQRIAPYLRGESIQTQVMAYKEKLVSLYHYFEGLYEYAITIDNEIRFDCIRRNENTGVISLRDNVIFQIAFHYYSSKAAINCCEGYLQFAEKNILMAFMKLSEAIEAQRQLKEWMDSVQHGQWTNFYRADWLTNIGATMYSLQAARSYLRIIGDGPDLFYWHKYNIMPCEERQIYLENTQRQVFDDETLYEKLSCLD